MPTPQGPKRSWKKDTSKNQPEAAGKRSWQHGKTNSEPVSGKASGRFIKRAAAFLALLVVAGSIIYIWRLFGDTKPLTLLVLSYPGPPGLNSPASIYNTHAQRDLITWVGEDPQKRKLIQAPEAHWKNQDQTAQKWMSWLLAEARNAGEIVVFYFGVPGHADSRGPFLWLVPTEASHPDQAHRLYVSDLLDKAQEELNGKKLLFLFDASQCDHSDIHGMMTNDFARGLKTLEEKISAIPQCYIVQASSENQLSWLCPEQGKSIFSHYLCHGLRGGAQVNRPMISIKNLYDYLAEKTMKWSLANRGSPQKPMFLPASKLSEADSIEVATVDEKKVPPEPRPIPRDALPQEIKADWDRYTQLAKLTPSPEVVAPYQWKQYTAQLLRLEEMLYAGAEEKDVSSWRNAMTKLAGEIREQCKPFSAGNNPMLLDRVAPDARTREQDKTLAEATTGLNLLWKSDNPEKLTEDVQIWKKLITSIQDNPEMRRQVLVHGWRWTMEKLAQEPDLLATERVLSVLEETIPPSHRPADVQFVRLLVRDTQEKPWSLVRNQPELIKLAVSTRTRAERMAWMGSDAVAGNVTVHWVQVQRCLAKLLETADAMRLEAEDLLFDAHASSWEKSRELFLQANEKYTQAAEQAQELISACELRDQLYYQLPFIHDWAASQPAAFPDRVMEAWSALHQLSQMLLETPLDHQLLRTRSDSLRKLATELHVYIHRALENEERSSTSATAEPYLNLKRILAMPAFTEAIPGNSVDERWNIAIKRRLELLGRLRTISSKLYENTEQPENVQESRILYQPDAHADTRLRLSYARMGNDTLEFIQNAGVTNLKLSWNVERQVAPQKQFESIQLISSKLGILWSFLPQALTQSEPAQKAFELLHATATAATLPTAEQWILQAAQLTRQLDPGTSEPRHKYNQLNSMQIARSYFTYRFLLSQAMRSQAEGWAELQPGERDYSLKVAQLHIDAAKEILDALAKEKSVEHRDRGWHAQFVEDRKKLERPLDKLVLTMNGLSPPKVLPITDEPYVTMKVGMQTSSTGTPRTGFPVLRLWSAGVDVAVSPITLKERFVAGFKSHFSRALSAKSVPVDEELQWENKDTDNEETTSKLKRPLLKAVLYHRGHYIVQQNIDIARQAMPHIRWVKNAPDNQQGIVVFGEDRLRDGHIHIMFDTTHSMNDTLKGQSISKIRAARQALKETLRELPGDVLLSISAFRGIEGKPGVPSNTMILHPTPWRDTDNLIKMILEALPTEKIFEDEYNKQGIRTNTPILQGVREILYQEEQGILFLIDKKKPFTLLLLTDGAENVSKARSVPEELRQLFLNCKIPSLNCHILLFSLEDPKPDDKDRQAKLDEIAKMKELEKINSEEYQRSFLVNRLTPPRVWPGMDEVPVLVKSLNEALRARFAVLKNSQPAKDTNNQDVINRQLSPEVSGWKRVYLPPGSYDLVTSGIQQRFQLEKGDRLGLKVSRNEIQIPGLANLQPAVSDPYVRRKEGVQLAILEQKMLSVPGGGYALTIQSLLDKPIQRVSQEATLARQRPKFAWFQMIPLQSEETQQNRINLTITENLHELAPLWTIQANNWPPRVTGANPMVSRTGYRLQAYWLDSASESVTGSGITITNPYGTQGRASISGSLHVRGGQILDVMNRQRPNDSRQWLYVRCQFEPGNPLLIQLRTRENSSPGFTRRDIAEEHRYFMEANSVSAWFDLSALSREMELKLDVYSLKDLLQQPSPRCIHLEYETTDVTDQASRLKSWEHQ